MQITKMRMDFYGIDADGKTVMGPLSDRRQAYRKGFLVRLEKKDETYTHWPREAHPVTFRHITWTERFTSMLFALLTAI